MEEFYTVNDPRCENVEGMLANGRLLHESRSHRLVVVDGQVWLKQKALGLPYGEIMRLGKYPDVLERFPALNEDT